MKVHLPASRKARIEILPLIDIVFLLLVFFIYALLSMAVHRGLPVELPQARQAPVEKQLVISVTVTAAGSIFVDRVPVPAARLADALRRRAAGGRPEGVLIFADRRLPYEQLYGVLEQVRRAGIRRVSLQADAGAGP